MTHTIYLLLIAGILSIAGGCKGQTPADKTPRKVGGAFENADYIYIGIPQTITATDTSSGWHQKGQKLLITGTVYQADGATPAKDVILYYYHTNVAGRYVHDPYEPRSMAPNALGQTHGSIRGWVKTDTDGRYAIYTVRPGTYPTRDEPDHIHVTVKEPNDLNEYYIDDFVFDDDKLLTGTKRKKLENRGGSGVLRLATLSNLQVGERNIILGLNIPDYPNKTENAIQSGPQVGEDVFSFIPFHAWGPDKGTRTCPVCKYGWYHGILYFAGKNENPDDIKQWLQFLESESVKRKGLVKVFFIYGNENGYSQAAREKELAALGAALQLKNVALTYVPSFTDSESEVDLNKINPDVANTFLIYRRSNVIGKYINVKPTKENFTGIASLLDKTSNEYFALPKPATYN